MYHTVIAAKMWLQKRRLQVGRRSLCKEINVQQETEVPCFCWTIRFSLIKRDAWHWAAVRFNITYGSIGEPV